jgi:hypothetical protein
MVALLLGTSLAISCSSSPTQGIYLKPISGQVLISLTQVKVNEPLFLAALDVIEREPGTEPIHLLKVEVLGLPKTVVLDRVGAIRFPSQIPGRTGIYQGEEGTTAGIDFRLEMKPVDSITLRKPCVGGANDLCPGWYFMAEVHMTAPGTWTSRGTRVTYEVKGHTYYQDFGKLIGATTGTAPPTLPS